MIKKIVLFVLLSVVLFAEFAFAQCTGGSNGRAYIPGFGTGGATTGWTNGTRLYFSNISDVDIHVSVTLYEHDGTMITDDGVFTTGIISQSSGTTPTDYSDTGPVTFTLSSNKTVRLFLNTGATGKVGYGIIEWKSPNVINESKAMVAYGEVYSAQDVTGSYRMRSSGITINGGNPF